MSLASGKTLAKDLRPFNFSSFTTGTLVVGLYSFPDNGGTKRPTPAPLAVASFDSSFFVVSNTSSFGKVEVRDFKKFNDGYYMRIL